MIIAINAISAEKGGILTYTRNLVDSVSEYPDHRFHIWVPDDFSHRGGENIVLHRTRACRYNLVRRFLYEQVVLRKEINKIRAEVLFSSANYGVFSTKRNQVLLVQGPAVIYNPSFLQVIWPRYSLFQKIEKVVRRLLMRFSACYSNAILFPSYAMKDDFLTFYPVFRRKCSVNYYGLGDDGLRHALAKDSRSDGIRLLYVSVYYAHKNPGVVADAMRLIKSKGIRVSARITMEMESEHAKRIATWQADHDRLNHPGIRRQIKMGAVPHDRLPELYGGSDVFVFPSLVESFGYPLVEAMMAGLPVIAADTPINREICGDAALYFSALDPNDLAEKILLAYGDSEVRDYLISRASGRIHLFSREDHISRLMKIFEQRGSPVPPR